MALQRSSSTWFFSELVCFVDKHICVQCAFIDIIITLGNIRHLEWITKKNNENIRKWYPYSASYGWLRGEIHGMGIQIQGSMLCKSIRGNGGCFDPRIVVFVCMTPMRSDILSGWESKTMGSPEWAREWLWLGMESVQESGYCETLWSATCPLWVEARLRSDPVTVSCMCVNGRRQGLEQTMSALWVKRELGEFSWQWWQHLSNQHLTVWQCLHLGQTLWWSS